MIEITLNGDTYLIRQDHITFLRLTGNTIILGRFGQTDQVLKFLEPEEAEKNFEHIKSCLTLQYPQEQPRP